MKVKLVPFDIEKAKAGQKFVESISPTGTIVDNVWTNLEDNAFIGALRNEIVYEHHVHGRFREIRRRFPCDLRMVEEVKPKIIKGMIVKNINTGQLYVHAPNHTVFTSSSRPWKLIKEFEIEVDDE